MNIVRYKTTTLIILCFYIMAFTVLGVCLYKEYKIVEDTNEKISLINDTIDNKTIVFEKTINEYNKKFDMLEKKYENLSLNFINNDNLLVDKEKQIKTLDKKLSYVFESVQNDYPGLSFKSNVSEDIFDYLAIGNSITLHGICDYWWGNYGMAASSIDNDYYHLVCNNIIKNGLVGTIGTKDDINGNSVFEFLQLCIRTKCLQCIIVHW